MELDLLKSVWQDVGSNQSATTSQEELEQLLGKKSKTPIARLKRNLFWELIAVVILYTATIAYYFVTYKGAVLSIAWMMIVVGALYVWYYVSKRKLLKSMECVTCEVKSNLSTQLVTLEKYVKLYLWAGTLLFPVVFMFTLLVGYLYAPETQKMPGKDIPNFFIIYTVVCFVFSIVLTVPIYFLNKWYVHKLYGQHVKKLKHILNEMNEPPFTKAST